MSVYAWSVYLVRDLECTARNFNWSGEMTKIKMVDVSWKNICKPFTEGGLGLRYLVTLNEATNLKLCWDLFNSEKPLAMLLKHWVLRKNKAIEHNIFSSI